MLTRSACQGKRVNGSTGNGERVGVVNNIFIFFLRNGNGNFPTQKTNLLKLAPLGTVFQLAIARQLDNGVLEHVKALGLARVQGKARKSSEEEEGFSRAPMGSQHATPMASVQHNADGTTQHQNKGGQRTNCLRSALRFGESRVCS